MAPRSKYSPETADKIAARLRAGNTLRASAQSVGISEDTLLGWRHRYSAFSALIDQAEASAEVMYAAVLAKAAQDGDWRAAITWLERRRSDDWRERKELQHTGKDGERLGALSDDDIDAQIAALLGRSPPAPRPPTGTATETLSD